MFNHRKMKSIDLKVSKRQHLGKKDAAKLRKAGQVPCVMYGGEGNLHFFAHENTFRHLLYTHNVYLVNLDVDGEKHQAILKEVQMHPVKDSLVHIDFLEVFSDKITTVALPVEITGNSEGVKAGGKLRQRKRYVRVRGLVKDMPDSLVLDITDLEIGQSILAGDLKYDKVEILDPPYALIVGVISSRAAARGSELPEEEEEAAAAEEAAEAAEEQPAEEQ